MVSQGATSSGPHAIGRQILRHSCQYATVISDNMLLAVPWLLRLGSFLFWGGLYLYCSVRKPDKCPEWWSREITLLHGSVCTIFGLYFCGMPSFEKGCFTKAIGISHYILMLWSWGYFAFDLLWCLLYWSKNKLMLCHHIAALGGIDMYMRKRNTGCTYPCTIAFMEITNPLLQTRWFLRGGGFGQTLLYYIVEITYLIMFIGLRGVFGTLILYKVLTTDIFERDAKLITVVFYMVSMGLIQEILGYVIYKYRSKIEEFAGFLDEMGIILNEQI